MADDLARLRPAGAEAHAVDDAVEAPLARGRQLLAGNAFGLGGLFIHPAELRFEDAINAAHLLLFTKLQAIADDFGFAVLAVLSGDKVAALDGTFLAMASLALQVKFHALAPALPA